MNLHIHHMAISDDHSSNMVGAIAARLRQRMGGIRKCITNARSEQFCYILLQSFLLVRIYDSGVGRVALTIYGGA